MEEAKDILRKLVSINTIKDKENRTIINYLEELLTKYGFVVESKDKYLVMKNKNVQGLGFVGHTDTVEYIDGWKYPKFDITIKNGKIYGLGVCDMKGSIAAIISAISQLDFNKLSKGIKLIFTYDEEIGFSGIKEVTKIVKDYPETIIVGEPTNNEFIVGSKGLLEFKISFKGIKCHSSNPEKGENAILKMIEFINELKSYYDSEIKTIKNKNFEIDYTTMNLGVINGGSAINSVPAEAECLIDFRTTEAYLEKEILDKVDMLAKKYDANVKIINRLEPFYNDSKYGNKTAGFITEAGFLPNEKIILGPGPITAHEVDEYIKEESFYKLIEAYKNIITEKCQ